MKKLLLTLAAAAALVLASCGAWPEQKRLDAIAVVTTMEEQGQITPAQAEAMREVIDEMAAGFTLEDFVKWFAAMGGSALAAFLGIQKVRGPAKPLDKNGGVAAFYAMVEREKAKAKKS